MLRYITNDSNLSMQPTKLEYVLQLRQFILDVHNARYFSHGLIRQLAGRTFGNKSTSN